MSSSNVALIFPKMKRTLAVVIFLWANIVAHAQIINTLDGNDVFTSAFWTANSGANAQSAATGFTSDATAMATVMATIEDEDIDFGQAISFRTGLVTFDDGTGTVTVQAAALSGAWDFTLPNADVSFGAGGLAILDDASLGAVATTLFGDGTAIGNITTVLDGYYYTESEADAFAADPAAGFSGFSASTWRSGLGLTDGSANLALDALQLDDNWLWDGDIGDGRMRLTRLTTLGAVMTFDDDTGDIEAPYADGANGDSLLNRDALDARFQALDSDLTTIAAANNSTTLAALSGSYYTESEANNLIYSRAPHAGVYFEQLGYAEVNLTPSQLGDSFSLVWFGIVSAVASGGSANTVFGALRGTSGWHAGGVGIAHDGTKFRFNNEYSGVGVEELLASEDSALGQVVMIVATYEADGTASLYQDGVLVGSEDWSGTANFNSTQKLQLMRSISGSGVQYDARCPSGTTHFAGVFNNALSESEVLSLYQNGVLSFLAKNPQYQWGDNDLIEAVGTGSTWANWFGTGTISNSTATSFDIDAGAGAGADPLAVQKSPTERTAIDIASGETLAVTMTISGLDSAASIQLKEYNNASGTSLSVAVNNGTATYLITATGRSGWLTISAITSSAGGSVSFDSITKLGAVAAYMMDEGIGYQIRDLSTNHHDGLLSTSGFQHLIPKASGYVRAFGVNAYNGGSGNVELLSSSRAIKPTKARWSKSMIVNSGSAAIGAGLLDVKESNRTTRTTIGDNAVSIAATKALPVSLEDTATTPNFNNLAVDGSGDSDATDVDIIAHFELVE